MSSSRSQSRASAVRRPSYAEDDDEEEDDELSLRSPAPSTVPPPPAALNLSNSLPEVIPVAEGTVSTRDANQRTRRETSHPATRIQPVRLSTTTASLSASHASSYAYGAPSIGSRIGSTSTQGAARGGGGGRNKGTYRETLGEDQDDIEEQERADLGEVDERSRGNRGDESRRTTARTRYNETSENDRRPSSSTSAHPLPAPAGPDIVNAPKGIVPEARRASRKFPQPAATDSFHRSTPSSSSQNKTLATTATTARIVSGSSVNIATAFSNAFVYSRTLGQNPLMRTGNAGTELPDAEGQDEDQYQESMEVEEIQRGKRKAHASLDSDDSDQEAPTRASPKRSKHAREGGSRRSTSEPSTGSESSENDSTTHRRPSKGQGRVASSRQSSSRNGRNDIERAEADDVDMQQEEEEQDEEGGPLTPKASTSILFPPGSSFFPNLSPAPADQSAYYQNGNQYGDRENSFEDSGVRGSEYEFSEEERIVIAIEEERARQIEATRLARERQKEQERQDRLTAANAATPPPPVAASLHHRSLAVVSAMKTNSSLKMNGNGSGGTKKRRLGKGPEKLALPAMIGAEQVVAVEEEQQVIRGSSTSEIIDWITASAARMGEESWKKLSELKVDSNRFSKGFVGVLLLAMIISALTSSTSLPFLHPRSTYSTPALPPDSLAELITRLTVLESALGRLSSLSESERAQSSRGQSRISAVTDQVSRLERALSETQLQGIKVAQSEGVEREKVMGMMRRDLEGLGARIKSLADDRVSDVDDIGTLKRGIDSVGKEIAALGTNLAQVTKDVRIGADADVVVRSTLAAIEARLPSRLAVKLDEKTGALEIDPVFWKYLKSAFVEKKDLDRMSSPSSSAALSLSWDEFLTSNEASLRAWIESDIDSRIRSDAIISKRAFLDILRREIKTMKQDFEIKANENVQKIGTELLSKVARQEHLKKEGIVAALNPFARPVSPSSSTSSQQQQVTIKSSDGQNITALIGDLVDSALLRYSKDILARPDYALFTSGGRVIPSLTSLTYSARPQGPSPSRISSFFFGSPSTPGRPPVTALHPDNSLGSCWPFAGSYGQLGILLSRRVIPSDISIEHASIDVALDAELGSAPKGFELWGVVEAEEDLVKLREYRAERSRKAVADEERVAAEEEESASLPPTPNHILLAVGSYDITLPSPIQSFPVTAMAKELGIPVGVVVLKILSNHGESRYTCLYRVRVGGSTQ